MIDGINFASFRPDELPEEPRTLYDALEEQIGAEPAFRALLVFAENYGGLQRYFPKSDTIFRAQRDRQICAEFDGANIDKLARQYSLSSTRIREIISAGMKGRNGTKR